MTAPATFRPEDRLRTGPEFQRVFRGGLRVDGPLFLLLVIDSTAGRHRLGLAVGRKVGGAVRRNRAKRLLRDSFRRLRPEAQPHLDLVVVAKPDIVGKTQAEVDHEFRQRLQRLTRVRARRPPVARLH